MIRIVPIASLRSNALRTTSSRTTVSRGSMTRVMKLCSPSLLTPASMMRKASSFWSTVHSQGNLAVESQEPHKAKVILTQFSSEPAHCARLAGWMEGAGEMTGAKNVDVVHDACIARGATECTWQITWT
ncbi:MAG: hypothetical protein LC732_01195 [Acidobacteria bacterium]|nr:hypothetical protein [Acidobacteriota bacterium]